MEPFMNKTKKLGLLIINILIIGTSSFFICKSEQFQKKISPKKYWQSKISTLESELKKDLVKIKSLTLDLEKENALSPFHEKQALIQAEEANLNFDEIFTQIESDHVIKISEIQHEIEKLTLHEKEVKKDLDIAYNKIKAIN